MNGENDMDKMYRWMDMSCKETGFLAEEGAPDVGLLILICLAFMIPIVTFAAVVMFT